MKLCLYCSKETKNPKFCSRTCSAIHSNTSNPKRKPTHTCLECDKKINSKRARCEFHYKEWKKEQEPIDMPISEIMYDNHHRSSSYALVRTRARAIANKCGWTACAKCGYSKHIQIAHIKPIASFDKSTLVSVVNSLDNLIPLCPNCHWEFDHS